MPTTHDYTDEEMATMRRECAEHHSLMLWESGEMFDAIYYGFSKGYRYMPENEVIDYFVDNWNDVDFTVPYKNYKNRQLARKVKKS